MDRKFSRIENLWPRDGSCPLPLRSKRIFNKCFWIVKAQKISRGGVAHVRGSPFAPNAVPAPVLQRRCPAHSRKVWGHGAVSRSDGLCKIQGTVWRKPGAVQTLQPASFKHKDNTLKLYNEQPKTNFRRLNNHIRFYLWKRKIPPTQRSDDFVEWIGGKMNRVCCGAVDLLGMIHGEAVFKMNTTTSCGWFQTNPQNQWDLWQRISCFARCVKMILKNLWR